MKMKMKMKMMKDEDEDEVAGGLAGKQAAPVGSFASIGSRMMNLTFAAGPWNVLPGLMNGRHVGTRDEGAV